MPRKTIAVDQIRAFANKKLAMPNSHSALFDRITPEQAFRRGIASLLEQILHTTDNYKGFNYQDSELNPDRTFDSDSDAPTLREGYDETRRIYY